MNAGAYLKSTSDVLVDAKVLDENYNIKVLKNEDLNYSYRHSSLIGSKYIVLSARFKLVKGDKKQIVDLINDRRKRRLESQPLEYPSAGSVFRNPEGEFSGHLIEESGLKGKTYGGAEISHKHANFIINKDGATSRDIKYLMDLAQKEVKEKYNIDLKREQELFNWE
jgi:UDP-N-acetylenolpyruvoylglucosamine reductase